MTGPQLRARFGLFDTWAYFTTVSSNGSRSPVAPPTPAAPVNPEAPATTTPAAPTGGVTAQARAARAARAAGVRAPVLSGRIEPAAPGARIKVERRVRGTWRLAVDASLDANGRYAVGVGSRGVYRVRYAGTVAGPAVRVR